MGEFTEIRRKLQPIAVRCAFVFAVLCVYLVFGGILFRLLEHGPREDFVQEATEELEEERAELLKALWARSISRSEQDWTYAANQRLDMYERTMREYVLQGVDVEDDDDDNPWTFIGSIFYCFTVVTTIGYGNLYPVTLLGRLMTVIYGLVGIPLTLYYMAEVGKLLTLALKFALKKRWPDYDSSEDFNFAPGFAVGITVSYLVIGGVMFDLIEDDWNFIDATYFSFISFSTIGFGDLVPDSQGYMLLLMVYSLSALSICGMCFVVIQNAAENFLTQKQDVLAEWCRQFLRKRAAARAKKTDDDKVKTPRITEEDEEEVVEEEDFEDDLDK